MTSRDDYFDNAKFILILLVVLGHCLEIAGINAVPGLYRLLYLFHMPVFVTITGYFSKRCKPLQLAALVLQYLVFETLYLLFANCVLGAATGFDYTRPYWTLWFLVSTVTWKALAPLWGRLPARLALPASVAAQLGFLPAAFLYGAAPYSSFGFAGAAPALLRLLCLAWGFVLGCCFLALVPAGKRRYSAMGGRTLALYLLHGFLMKYLGLATPLPHLLGSPASRCVFFALMAAVSLLLLTRPVSRALNALTGPLRALARRRQRAAL